MRLMLIGMWLNGWLNGGKIFVNVSLFVFESDFESIEVEIYCLGYY